MSDCDHQWEITKNKDGNKLLRCSVRGCGAHGVVLSSEKYSELRDVAADVHRLRELEHKIEKTRQPVTNGKCPHKDWDIINNPVTHNLDAASCMGCNAYGYVVEESELAALREAQGDLYKRNGQNRDLMDERDSLQAELDVARKRVAELEKQVKFQESAWDMLNRVCNQFKHFNRVVTNLYRGLPAFQTTEDSHRFITRIGEEIRKHEAIEYGHQPADSKSATRNDE